MPPCDEALEAAVARVLASAGVLEYSEEPVYRLSSGRLSRYYVDVRRAWASPRAARALALAAAACVRLHGLGRVVAGVATGGIPLAAGAALILGAPLAYVRPERKGHGLGRLVEGADVRGESVVVVDDVATTGASVARAVEALRRQGARVEAALVAVDRGEGASEALRSLGVTLYSLTTLASLAREAGAPPP